MKIGIIAPPYAPILDGIDYGGAELFIKSLCKLLSKAGNEVILFASKNSSIAGIEIVRHRFESHNVSRSVSIGGNISEKHSDEVNCYRDYEIDPRDFDIIHCDWLNWFSASALSSPNTVFRTHSTNVNSSLRNILSGRNVNIVPNSEFSKKVFDDICLTKSVIYNSIDVKKVPFMEKSLGYAVWAGRIIRYKGVLEAINLSSEIGIPLKIVGRIQDKMFWEEIKPLIRGRVEYLGFMERKELLDTICHADFTFQTSLANESFGNITLESLACGTPVIAFDSGATREIVTREVGEVSNDRSVLVKRAKDIGGIDRKKCRQRAKIFSEDVMLKKYAKVFREVSGK